MAGHGPQEGGGPRPLCPIALGGRAPEAEQAPQAEVTTQLPAQGTELWSAQGHRLGHGGGWSRGRPVRPRHPGPTRGARASPRACACARDTRVADVCYRQRAKGHAPNGGEQRPRCAPSVTSGGGGSGRPRADPAVRQGLQQLGSPPHCPQTRRDDVPCLCEPPQNSGGEEVCVPVRRQEMVWEQWHPRASFHDMQRGRGQGAAAGTPEGAHAGVWGRRGAACALAARACAPRGRACQLHPRTQARPKSAREPWCCAQACTGSGATCSWAGVGRDSLSLVGRQATVQCSTRGLEAAEPAGQCPPELAPWEPVYVGFGARPTGPRPALMRVAQ